MLKVTIGDPEGYNYNSVTKEFTVAQPVVTFEIEHSLVSLSKWESKYMTAFLVDDPKTNEQLIEYVKFMVVTPGFDPETIQFLSPEEHKQIHEYINSTASATTFGSMPKTTGQAEKITAELIYYWMTAFNIPWEAQTWHLNKLFALIRICNLKQQKPKKRSPQEIAEWQREENERRLKKYETTG